MSSQHAHGSATDGSLDEFYARHRRIFVRIAFSILGDLTSAEEVVQEAFAVLSATWPEIQQPTRAAHARRAVVHGCLSRRRTRRHERCLDRAALPA